MSDVYSCPSIAHRGNPVPLAENAEGMFACVMRHEFRLERDEEMGTVFRDLKSGILHEVVLLDLSLLTYRPEQQFEPIDLKREAVDVPKPAAPAPPPPPTAPKKKVRKISTTSTLVLREGLNFNQLNLNPAEWKLIAKIDGSANVKDVVEASRLESKAAYDALAGLIKRGVVDIREVE